MNDHEPPITNHYSPITFHYLPPGAEEQRAFAMQFLGTILGVGVAVALSLATRDNGLKAALWGASLAIIWVLARAAWQLERKARRAQAEEIGVDENGLHFDNGRNRTLWNWRDIEECEVQGGKLLLKYDQSTLQLSAREIEDGMKLMREIATRWNSAHNRAAAPSNFIPLSPR